MYLDLKSKLQMYKETPKNIIKEEKRGGPDINELLQGSVCSSEEGSYYLIENRFPMTYLHGGCNLGKAVESDISPLLKVCGYSEYALSTRDCVFLDTETTGLSGGTGTVAFLIGAGFFAEDAFVLRQYFMRDYDEEYPILLSLNNLLSSFKGLVTFNGKAFDWNLLLTRFTANRIRPKLKNPIHLDLLYPSRILWKPKLESCRLSSLEENILEEYRVDDIPGAMIPWVYFKYIDNKDATEIKKVITHNEKDILSMISLLLRINSILSAPFSETEDGWELFGAGRVFEKLEDKANAIECYKKLSSCENHVIKELSRKKLAYIHKRNKDYLQSIEQLKLIVSNASTPNIPVMIELAKQYEHRLKDLQSAEEIVRQAINACTQVSCLRNMYYNDLKKRLQRLNKKTSTRQIL